MNRERTVTIVQEISREKSVELLRAGGMNEFRGLEDSIPDFHEVKLGAFRAEWAIIGQDLVFHFFPEKGTYKHLWEVAFPKVLDEEAQAYFKATYPRLIAKYTEEMFSWWVKAQGFALALNPPQLAEGFLRHMADKVECLGLQAPGTQQPSA